MTCGQFMTIFVREFKHCCQKDGSSEYKKQNPQVYPYKHKTIIYYQMSTNIIIDNVAFIIHSQQVDILQFYDFSYFMQACVQACFKVSICLNMF